ncbi:MAG: Two component, Sigma-54 Specific, central transcriptional regulator of acidic amino acid uptake [uncultured Thiotrichaceae bacterium]|uniref:Two component, Sigma-54 Specific, central transcriptional regulator of acidic amino acid uptake n=1 Tax=uncultured Thiotrichaceae bacterium TaxID=298394 RepID=A0A6S6SDR1_9GAMM|nr:MAG: Two component, Sigma-54 Specific, central transcriptional regulator of acidic amino acid uptake [uncultured Thiotrichaceae bacterium]
MMNPPTILLVDDEDSVRKSTAQSLQLADLDVDVFSSAKAVIPRLSTDFNGVLLTDICMPNMDGIELMRHSLAIDPKLPVILISGHADVATAVSAIQEGAYDLLEKPFSTSILIDKIKRAIEQRQLTLENRLLREELADQNRVGPRIIGKSPSMAQLRNMIRKIANTDTDVLIMGETGTGKELVARSLHEQSQRRDNNFVAINCGAIQEQLLNSELFGHEAGAFTDAKKQRIGKFEHANGGTLFLDEIESMAISTQVPLLRVLQERSIERLGSNHSFPLNLRVLAATKVDLKDAAEREEFREDLYYRLNVVTLELPPLRERREDIPILFQHFVMVAAARCEAEMPALEHNALQSLLEHDWPGNIRELRNIAERYVLLGESYDFDISALMNADKISNGLTLPEQVSCFEKTLIEQALTHYKGDLGNIMSALGLPRKTLSDKMKKYQLERKRYMK